MIKGQVSFKFYKPDLDITKELEMIAHKDVIPEIAGRIQNGVDINDNKYAPLDNKTIKAKGHDRPLIGKERLLFKSFFYKAQGKNKVLVSVKNNRKDIADILQNVGVRSKKYGRRKFEFFGVTKSMEKNGMDRIVKAIDRAIENAR